MSRDLAERLATRTIARPGGGEAVAVGAVLTRERLARCLETISEAGAWPSAWLIVRDEARPFDLVARIRLDESGRLADPEPLFATARRDWEAAGALESAVREATGQAPTRDRSRRVVVQTFTPRVETVYAYEPAGDSERKKGLLALLPPGAQIREARSVDLGDGRRHTVALVVLDARFHPSICADCAARFEGHSDSGTILAVLAAESVLEDRLDLTGLLADAQGTARLPRFACEPGDERASESARPIALRFDSREPLSLLRPDDVDGDGRKLEFALPVSFLACDRHSAAILAVEAGETPRLRLVPVVDGDRQERAAEGLDRAAPGVEIESVAPCVAGSGHETVRTIAFDPKARAFRVRATTTRPCAAR